MYQYIFKKASCKARRPFCECTYINSFYSDSDMHFYCSIISIHIGISSSLAFFKIPPIISYVSYSYNNISSFKLIVCNSSSISSHAKCETLAPGIKELFMKLTSVCPSSRSVVFTLLAEQRSLIIFELVTTASLIKCPRG